MLALATPERARAWVERVSAGERAHFPLVAYLEAQRALAEGWEGERLRGVYEALLRYRDTEDGREQPGVSGLAAALAEKLGESGAAALLRQADRRQRAVAGQPIVEQAQRALAAGRLEEADRHLAAAGLLPGDPQILMLRARLDAENVLAKVDLDIASRYAALAGDVGEIVFPLIRAESDRTVKLVLKIKGRENLLDDDPRLQRSIRLRNPYVDPMSLLQVDLLRRWRSSERQDEELFAACREPIAIRSMTSIGVARRK